MRVLVVTHNYPRFQGDPAGAFVERLARGAHEHGATVMVVAPHAPGLPRHEVRDGITVARFRYAPDALERVAYRGDMHLPTVADPMAVLGIPLFLAAFRRAVRRAAASFAPTVVHAHWWVPGGWLAVGTGVPTVITCHGSDVRLLARSALLRALASRVLPHACAITTVSDYLARTLQAALPQLAGRVHTVAMPLDLSRFEAGAGTPRAVPPRVLYAGNLIASKGVEDLVRAVHLLRTRGGACVLRVLGQGPERAALERLAATLDAAPFVEWSRFVPQEAMPAEYAASTITVLPTRGNEEGLGLTLAEALLAGAAVIGTSAGGIPEIVRDGETGLLARGGDPAHLAEQLERLLTSGTLRERLAAAGRRHVRAHFAPEQSLTQFLALYRAAPDHSAA